MPLYRYTIGLGNLTNRPIPKKNPTTLRNIGTKERQIMIRKRTMGNLFYSHYAELAKLNIVLIIISR